MANTVARRNLSPELYQPRELPYVLRYIARVPPLYLQLISDPLQDICSYYQYFYVNHSMTDLENIYQGSSV